MGTVPYGLLLPLLFLWCANASASLMIFQSPSFPSLWSPSSGFLPHSRSLSPFFPHFLLPHGPSFFISVPFPPRVSGLCVFLFSYFLFWDVGPGFMRREKKRSPSVGKAAPVKLNVLCQKNVSHLFSLFSLYAYFGHICTRSLTLPQLFFGHACWSANVSPLRCFSPLTPHVLLTHLLEVSAEQNRRLYCQPRTQGTGLHLLCTHFLPPYTSPICEGNYVPPSHPRKPHTLTNHIHPSVHLHPSCFFQSHNPFRLPGLQCPGFL